jgi:hypothetical protein
VLQLGSLLQALLAVEKKKGVILSQQVLLTM